MATTLFQRRPGSNSLRAAPNYWTPTEGSFVFVLGSDEPGREGRFNRNDSVRVSQTDTIGTARFVRSRARLRGPSTMPTGWRWEAYAKAYADEAWVFTLFPGQTRDLSDLAINAQSLGGGINLEFGLRLIGPSGADAVNVELPAFYADEVVLDELTEGLIVANRSPEPGAAGIPIDEAVQFDLMDTANSPDNANTRVWLDDVLVYDGTAGGAQPGYTVTITTPFTGVRRFRVVAPYTFASLAVVPVRVTSQNLSATHLLDESWSFTVEDLTAPHLESAVSRSHDVVRVTFDEPVSGAMLASAYTIERLEAPSVNVNVVAAEQVSPREYDLTLDIPITRGALYRITAADIVDAFGNTIAAPYNQALFRGYECPPVAGRTFELWKMIPEYNRNEDVSRDLFKTISVLQEVVDLLLCDVDRWTEILDVDLAAERYLDQMLIGLGNPFSFDLDADGKRRLIRTLVDMYRLKGTAVGIIAVVRFFLAVEIEIVPFSSFGWVLGEDELGFDAILGPGTDRALYSFEVVSPRNLTTSEREQMTSIVKYMKPAHTHLVRIAEPASVITIDHLELGLSVLGDSEWLLH